LRRKLVAVEQLRSPARLAQLSVVDSARTRAAARSAQRLIHRFPEIEVLATAAELEGPGRRRERLLHDLVRLAAASAAHRRELRHIGPPFDVRPELAPKERRLVLVGTRTPSPEGGDAPELRARVAEAIRTRRLEEIVWDNSAVQGYLTFASAPPASLDIGYHVVGGAHRFTALMELAREDPEGVIAALEPFFKPRPEDAVHELGRVRASALRALLEPGTAAALAGATLRAISTSKDLRRLVRAYLANAEARAEAPLELVLKDLVRLWLVGQIRTNLELDADRATLVYRSDEAAVQDGTDLEPGFVRSLEGIVWDHSAGGSPVTSADRPHISVSLEGGTYEFEGLTLVARRFPELAAPALLRAAASDG